MKNIATIVAAAVLTAPAFSQDFDRLAPKQLPPREPVPAGAKPPPQPLGGGSDAVLLKRLKGLVFVPTPAAVQSGGVRGASGVVVKNIALLESPKFTARMQPYIGAPLTLGALAKIQNEVTAFYTGHDRPLVSISVPEQDITSGVVQIIVQEGMLGEVRVEGNRYFKAPLFRSGVRLREGEAIYKSRLEQDTRGLNANPFRSVDTVFSPGRTPGTTDLVLQVQDRFPLRVYAGYENTGTPATDENRLLAGFNWGNAFGLGHQLNYQFTASPDVERLRAHSASYLVPLPWQHTLALFGSYAETTPDLPAGFELNGRTYQTSLRYSMRLPDVTAYTHEVALGYDFKSSNNDLGFGGTRVFDTTIDISQFVLTYNGALPDAYGRTLLNAEVYWSPGGLGEHNEDEDFAAASPGASASYVYGKLTPPAHHAAARGFLASQLRHRPVRRRPALRQRAARRRRLRHRPRLLRTRRQWRPRLPHVARTAHPRAPSRAHLRQRQAHRRPAVSRFLGLRHRPRPSACRRLAAEPDAFEHRRRPALRDQSQPRRARRLRLAACRSGI